MQIQKIKLAQLVPNTGQVPGLPSNPRQWTKSDVDRIAKSLAETPELFEARPIIAYPFDGKFVILGGNLRYEGARKNKDTEAPVIVLPEDTPADKLKEIVIKDNGNFGAWDFDALANEWDNGRLLDWGVPAWEQPKPIGPDEFGEDFKLPDGDKSPFQQISFQLPDEMAETLSLAIKAAQYSEDFYDIEGDEQDKNGNGVAIYIIAKEWCEKHLHDIDGKSLKDAEDGVKELRQYLRDSLKQSGKKAADVDDYLGTNGMSGHYFGASQWLFPTRKAYEKMREIMPLPRDYFECKKIELRYNLLKTLQEYKTDEQG
jgi:hypothetical protein